MKKHGYTVQGIEQEESARHYSKSNFGLTIQAPEHLFQTKEKFNVITLWHVLEHVHDIDGYFVRFDALLKDEGLRTAYRHWIAKIDVRYVGKRDRSEILGSWDDEASAQEPSEN